MVTGSSSSSSSRRRLTDRAANARDRLGPRALEGVEHRRFGSPQPRSSHGHPPEAGVGPPDRPPESHFKTFRAQSDYEVIRRTCGYLEGCGFYWGPMTVEAAHLKLKPEPPGTFLIRDSRQRNYFFSLSVQTAKEPISIRIQFQDGLFRLDGSKESFGCVLELLEHFTISPKKLLSKPLRKVRLQPLQELSRRRVVESFGKQNIDQLPLNSVLKDYLKTFPFRI
ncbi:suppressor of cytokine signaling 1a [Carcharodon carcharias]|uniref:suppressor of cytokine signaling 1a n=1 Tax=Carcharodon carcharias TaxID=13397 RepID=UPI001B7DCC8F|nr:suppressor of cytokine signaling 1a [Carcharodon carcharias]